MSRSAVFLHKYFASKIAMSNLFFLNIFVYHNIISPQPPSSTYSFHHRHNPSNNLTTPRPRVASTRFLSTCVLFLHKRPTPHNAVVSFPAFDGILRTESKVASSISVLATIFTAWINWVTSKLNYLEPSYTYAISQKGFTTTNLYQFFHWKSQILLDASFETCLVGVDMRKELGGQLGRHDCQKNTKNQLCFEQTGFWAEKPKRKMCFRAVFEQTPSFP